MTTLSQDELAFLAKTLYSQKVQMPGFDASGLPANDGVRAWVTARTGQCIKEWDVPRQPAP